MARPKRALPLRIQMAVIVLLCWLVPLLLGLTVTVYSSARARHQTWRTLTEQFQLNMKMSADRVDGAVQASRQPSYDPTFRAAWEQYQSDRNYAALNRQAYLLFNRLYQSDSRFVYGVFCFSEDPAKMTVTTVNGSFGLLYNQVQAWWSRDFDAVQALAADLDTAVGFLSKDGRVYLVRNLLDHNYKPIGVLALALDLPYYFQDMTSLPWVSALTVELGEGAVLVLKGDEPVLAGQGGLESSARVQGRMLSAHAAVDEGFLSAGLESYRYLLLAMDLSVLLLLMVTIRFLRRKVSQPVETLMEGAAEIERGNLGYQMSYRPNSQEFQYLTDSFNRMSGQLQNQFNRLYQEELARKDAQIKALQAHINPHFLNNTLENINWQARMNGDIKASKMIEALSTVLDAALDRKGSPEVRLAEEMTYVNAYLYIITERFGKRLRVDIDLPDELMDCLVPRLILQPVIENAVQHGIGPGGQGKVSLRGFRQGGYLILEIENDGGLTPEDQAHIDRLLAPDYDLIKEPSGNIGIANVNQRLRILYGPECGLTIFAGEGGLVTARLTIALEKERRPATRQE